MGSRRCWRGPGRAVRAGRGQRVEVGLGRAHRGPADVANRLRTRVVNAAISARSLLWGSRERTRAGLRTPAHGLRRSPGGAETVGGDIDQIPPASGSGPRGRIDMGLPPGADPDGMPLELSTSRPRRVLWPASRAHAGLCAAKLERAWAGSYCEMAPETTTQCRPASRDREFRLNVLGTRDAAGTRGWAGWPSSFSWRFGTVDLAALGFERLIEGRTLLELGMSSANPENLVGARLVQWHWLQQASLYCTAQLASVALELE